MKKTTKTIKTTLAEISLLENGFLYVEYMACKQDDIEVLKQQTVLTKEAFGTELYVLSNTTKVKHVSREVRNYFSCPEALDGVKVLAIVVGSGVSRIAGNLYLSFNKLPIPCKLFTNVKKAYAWLLEEEARMEHKK